MFYIFADTLQQVGRRKFVSLLDHSFVSERICQVQSWGQRRLRFAYFHFTSTHVHLRRSSCIIDHLPLRIVRASDQLRTFGNRAGLRSTANTLPHTLYSYVLPPSANFQVLLAIDSLSQSLFVTDDHDGACVPTSLRTASTSTPQIF